jgi:hypothetical protein
MPIVRHTDAEVLQEIAAILWPPHDPNQPWSSNTAQEVADALLLLRPGLQPWSFNCLVDHGWAVNALDCAERRVEAALDDYNESKGSCEAVETAESAVDALSELLRRSNPDD